MVPRPIRTESLSAPVLFRLVHQFQPTLLLDEVDAYLPQSEELRGLLNAGHKRGACAFRCEGPGTRAFNAFAPAVLAGLGSLPATLRDRSILIPLGEAQPGQLAARFDPLHTETEQALARQLARWASDNAPALAGCKPALPPGAFNRLADNWRPLLAVAQLAGGSWPARALAAFAQLASKPTSPAAALLPEVELLLVDIRGIFAQAAAPRLFSSTLVQALRALPDRPWAGTGPGEEPLTEKRLAHLLATCGIRSQDLRIGPEHTRGYLRSAFLPASTVAPAAPEADYEI